MRESVIQHIFKEGKRVQGQNFIKLKQQKIHDIDKNTSIRRKEIKELKKTQKGKAYPHKSKSIRQSVSYGSRSVRHFPLKRMLICASLIMKTQVIRKIILPATLLKLL